ncbi:GNAT family N-acetyltransferase [Amycolatopsis sp. CA-230715]|uniref:GNAT family N-acetyltransferase n=1 Tax=Amycolatopsis sp. CA-230715 TaxID=2745196 RepID=UPI001C01F91F|nr:GNAT family N-acetyltransferase [Amycolatopsis sp. CA-230715]QWF85431.1 N-acetyltransferase Eis [Amycolatopsis sp. CA-230715]
MGDYAVRPLRNEEEERAAFGLAKLVFHSGDSADERWELERDGFLGGRKVGAFAGDTVIGLAGSVATTLRVPGGADVTAAAVDGVVVRPDHTRRGVLTGMMRRQLDDCVAHGETVALLHASESAIYGRFGYGAATRAKDVRVRKVRARIRPDVPFEGQVRLLMPEEAVEAVPSLYRRLARRPGMIERPESWWHLYVQRLLGKVSGQYRVAVHRGVDGDDGFVVYQVTEERSMDDLFAGAVLDVGDLHGDGPAAVAGLWRFLLGVDLVDRVRAPARPLDEHIGDLFAEPRACETYRVADHTWVRLVDVEAALRARSYRRVEPVLIEVRDAFLPGNEGVYRIGSEGVERVAAQPQLRMDVDTLAMLYLGDRRAASLAVPGRIQVEDRGALAQVDELFSTLESPWCGTFF